MTAGRPQADVTVVTVTYQSRALMSEFSSALGRSLPDAAIVAVDNASGDGTPDALRASWPRAEVIELQQNIGFGRAANLGATAARSRWLLFCNPDVQLQAFVPPIPGDASRIGLAATSIDQRGTRLRVDTRAENTMLEDWLAHFASRLLPPALSQVTPPPRRRPAAWVSGALFLISREDFLSVNGFDPRFFMYFEDRDLGRRLLAHQVPITFAQGIRGTHVGAGSSNGVPSAGREALALLSWLEYVGIWRGAAAADVTARRLIRGLRSIGALRRTFGRDGRVARKADEATAIVHQVGRMAAEGELYCQGFYPHAIPAVAKVLDHSGSLPNGAPGDRFPE